jgi:glyoxylase-like metal-dependent hydrolase (beta-lactamase superfamily II)
MTRLEYITCRMLVADTGRPAPDDALRFYRAAGWDEEALERYRARFGMFGMAVSRLPESFTRVSDGDVIRIGDGDWRVIVGSGHSPEHACLYREADGVLISGDQVLPRISSNVSVFPTEPEANPLAEWIASCRKLAEVLPGDTLVLPSHNEPFYGLHERLDALVKGHERGLGRLEQRLDEPQRAVDVYGALFARPISGDNQSMATGEAIAHLNFLRMQGRVQRTITPEGVALYSRV